MKEECDGEEESGGEEAREEEDGQEGLPVQEVAGRSRLGGTRAMRAVPTQGRRTAFIPPAFHCLLEADFIRPEGG